MEILFVGFGGVLPLAEEAAKRFQNHKILSSRTVAEGLALFQTERRFVQPVYLLPGIAYERLREEVRRNPGPITVGKPLLHSQAAVNALAGILMAEYREQTALFVGHGTGHSSGKLYAELNAVFEKSGARMFAGVLDGNPDFADAQRWISANGAQSLALVPLTMGVGKHVQKEILGDSKASWFSRLQELGLHIRPVARGLCDHPAVRDMMYASMRPFLY